MFFNLLTIFFFINSIRKLYILFFTINCNKRHSKYKKIQFPLTLRSILKKCLRQEEYIYHDVITKVIIHNNFSHHEEAVKSIFVKL